jgi:rRNA maturation RNase YbeY
LRIRPSSPILHIRFQGRGRGPENQIETITRQTLREASRRLRLDRRNEISILLCDGPTIRRLNRKWRGIDKSTNVLSFAQQELTPPQKPIAAPLGDIVISLPVVRREARELEISYESRYRHMLIHGLLHLLGYDHETEAEARKMESLESKLLREMRTR